MQLIKFKTATSELEKEAAIMFVYYSHLYNVPGALIFTSLPKKQRFLQIPNGFYNGVYNGFYSFYTVSTTVVETVVEPVENLYRNR